MLLAIGCGAASSDAGTPVPGLPAQTPPWASRDLRAGIIGTDTSHVPEFTATFQSHPEWRIKVIGADRQIRTAAFVGRHDYGIHGVEALYAVVGKGCVSGRPPVDPAETIEIFEFMSAAQLSKERGGADISLAELRK